MPSPTAQTPYTESVSRRDTLLYCAPVLAYGFYFNFMILYAVKYSTDVLLISSTIVGVMFGLARLWDTISDPMVGYLSDRTRSRFGRRRPWIGAAAIPLGLVGIMMYTQPSGLSQTALAIWVGVGMIGIYTALTAIQVPHYAWGAELTPDYHERSRLFGAHTVAQYVGMLLALAGLAFVIWPDEGSLVSQKASVSQLSLGAGLIAFVLIMLCVVALPEKAPQRVANEPVLRSFATLWKNPHARILLIVNFIERTGYSTIGILTLYVADYVLGMQIFSLVIISLYIIAGGISTPLWVWLAGKYGKPRVWLSAMWLTAAGFNLLFLGAFLEQPQQLILFPVITLIVGAAAGCGSILSSSVLADVIDYDELHTGTRREGAYYACWHFSTKVSLSFMVVLIGAVMEFAGYIPNEVQTRTVILTIMGLYCLFPGVAHIIGAWLFRSKFRFDRAAHDTVRAALQSRHRQQASSG